MSNARFLPQLRAEKRNKERTLFTMRLQLPERVEVANIDPFEKTFILCVVVVFVNYN